MKKVLYLITKSNWGGAQRYVYDFATTLPKDTYEVLVAHGGEGLLAQKLKARGVRSLRVFGLERDVYFWRELRALWSLIALLRRERPDVVHLNSSKAAGLGALAARLVGVPRIIYTVHGWPFSEERPSYQQFLIRVFSWVTLVMSHKTIVLSEADRNACTWPLCNNRVVLIPNGVRDEHGFEREHARQILSADYGVPQSRFLVGSIAELHPNKGLADLIAALPMIPSDAHLCVIGDGALRERLEELAKHLGVRDRVTFLGFIPDASAFMAGFDAFALSSTKEGLPFVILEAGVQNVPIVATNVGGVPDVIQDGVTGRLVPTHKPDELARALGEVLLDAETARKHAACARENILKHFSFEDVTMPRTLALYSKTGN